MICFEWESEFWYPLGFSIFIFHFIDCTFCQLNESLLSQTSWNLDQFDFAVYERKINYLKRDMRFCWFFIFSLTTVSCWGFFKWKNWRKVYLKRFLGMMSIVWLENDFWFSLVTNLKFEIGVISGMVCSLPCGPVDTEPYSFIG